MAVSASLLIMQGSPAIPAYVRGTILPRNAKWIRPAQLTVTFGSPIDFSEVQKLEDKRELYRRMGEQVMQEIANLRGLTGGQVELLIPAGKMNPRQSHFMP